jgi:hypothetical protein
MPVIRPFGLRDAPVVKHLQTQSAAFDFKRCSLSTPNPTRSAVLGLVSRHHIGAHTLVHTGAAGSEPIAFVQLLPREDGLTWDVACIAPALEGDPAAACLWQDLLASSMLTAAEQGVMRICARLLVDGDSALVLRRSGFASVGYEEIFASSAKQTAVQMPPGLRHVTNDDAWALGELRRQVIPPLVYQAQWFTPEEAVSTAITSGASHVAMIWIDQGQIIAHLSLESTARARWVECIVRPERRGDLLPYLRFVLHVADGEGGRPVFVVVPDFGVGVGWLLRTLGYESVGRQQVMVAHTVSRVTVSRPVVAHGLEGRVDVVAH